jgi:hypothetical protein
LLNVARDRSWTIEEFELWTHVELGERGKPLFLL